MTEPDEFYSNCKKCNHQVELIPYVEGKDENLPMRTTTYSKYRHRQPHKNCSCPLYNMGDDEVF